MTSGNETHVDWTGVLQGMSDARAAGKTPFIRVTTDVEPGPVSSVPFGSTHVEVLIHPDVWGEIVDGLPDTSTMPEGFRWVATHVVFGDQPPRCFHAEFRPESCDVIATQDPDGTGEPYLCVSCAKELAA